MSDIDPSDETRPSEPAGEAPRPKPSEPKEPLDSAGIVSGCLLFPGAAVSAIVAMMAIGTGAPDLLTTVLICIAQMAGLIFFWLKISKETSWGMVALGVLLALGFYLLMIGACMMSTKWD